MPGRKAKPPRLYYRPDKGFWYILDRGRHSGTGCAQVETDKAADALKDYIARRHKPAVGVRDPAALSIADVLNWYEEQKKPPGFDEDPQPPPPAHDPQLLARHAELQRRINNLNEFFGAKPVAAIKAELCRDYARQRGRKASARRELEDLRAAVNAYHAEHVLSVVPKVTLPEKSAPRDRWLTRHEAARLLGASLGFVWDKERKRWSGRRDKVTRTRRRHAARYILVGLYSGRRDATIRRTQWVANTVAPWLDLERMIYHGRGREERMTRKRRPPAKIANRLRPHLARWARMDEEIAAALGAPVRHVVHRPDGRPLAGKIKTAWSGILADAGLGSDVVRHALKHTAATWLMQAGTDRWHAAGFLGITVEQLEEAYGHHHPDFQEEAAKGFGGKRG